MTVYCVKCTEVLDVIADEEVGAVLPVLPRDVPLAVHGGQPHPHPHTVRVPVPVVQHTLVIERAPGVQPPVPGGPGAHLSLLSDDCISHSQTQSALSSQNIQIGESILFLPPHV